MKAVLLALLLSFALSLLFCAAEIPLLKRLGAGQNILGYVKEHREKSGTPTMGGLGFVLAAGVSALFLQRRAEGPFYVVLAVGIGYLLVGFLDDLLKKIHRENLGLRPYQKILFQLAVAVIASVYCVRSGLTVLRIPFTSAAVDIGWGMLPLGVLVCIATVNSVNLTDGLDGLAGSTCAVFFLFFGALVLLQGEGAFSTVCFCLAGALFAYLIFNTNRASVFMGDTGSLSLGGFAAALCLLSGNALVLPFAGAMFVLSSISVILQVIYYKKTGGRRIFLMAPVHHHFQQKGYSEAKIAYCYAAVTAVLGALLLLPYV